MSKSAISPVLWLLALLCLAASLVTSFVELPPGMAGALSTFVLLAFVLLHGTAIYGLRGILVFLVICLAVSNAFENLSILTGFPFGHYHYTDKLGPKLFLVPILIGPAYFGVGYLSWVVARAILGDRDSCLRGALVFTVPIIASFIMVSWDLTMDPRMSTVRKNWIWEQGGSYFGVPMSNYLGWYLTVFVFYQLFALYSCRWPRPGRVLVVARGYWGPALFAYATVAIRPLLGLLAGEPVGTVTDAVGQVWLEHDIRTVSLLASLYTLVPFVLLAVMRSATHKGTP